MQLFEMQGLLAGKCLPGDIFVGESLSEYFLRQFNQRAELARQVSALQLSHDNIINSLGIKGDGPVSKLVIEYVMGLVAENVALHKFCKDSSFNADYEAELGMERGGFSDALDNIKTPATDAAIANTQAGALDVFANVAEEQLAKGKDKADVIDTGFNLGAEAMISMLRMSANALRAGRK